MQGTNHRSF